MKSSTKGLVVILVIVMCFFTVPVVFAGTGSGYNRHGSHQGSGDNGQGYHQGQPDRPHSCTDVVEGTVTWVSEIDGVIEVTGEDGVLFTVHGLPLFLEIEEGDAVVINCWISPDGKYVACYLTINTEPVIELR